MTISSQGRVVTVYRAIIGATTPSGKFAGVSDRELQKTGVFTDNRSFDQRKHYSGLYEEGDAIGAGLRVMGLPVFTKRAKNVK